MAAKLQYAIGPKLRDFILRHAKNISVYQLMDAQRSHYGKERCSSDELSAWIRIVQQAQKVGVSDCRILVRTERQLSLWRDYPPLDSLVDGEVAHQLIPV
jgi:hypothetical protein